MKREIKFRGKRVDNGEWAAGYLAYFFDLPNNSMIMPKCYFGTRDFGEEDDNGNPVVENELALGGFINVIPETVGQFTGLQDKNGKDIFEGDIVASTCNKMKPKKDETDLFETPEFELKTFHNVIDWFNGVRISGWRIKGKGFQTQLKWSTVGNMNLEVIGNIYDNPELLK